MSTAHGYLDYPLRKRGYDHDFYDWKMLPERAFPAWPEGNGLAIFAVVPLQTFRFDAAAAPYRPAGAPSKEYPDYREWSLKDYGLRVGAFRVFDELDKRGIPASVAIDAETARRCPRIVAEALRRGYEFVAHGTNGSDVIHEELDGQEEQRLIGDAIASVGEAAGAPVRGWLSPGRTHSRRTPDNLSAAGVEYLLDWAQDDAPVRMRTGTRTRGLLSLPLSHELNDVNSISQMHHTAPAWAAQVEDSVALLANERESGGRVLGLTLTPWLVGQPHRIPSLRRALDAVTGAKPWLATAGALASAAGDVD